MNNDCSIIILCIMTSLPRRRRPLLSFLWFALSLLLFVSIWIYTYIYIYICIHIWYICITVAIVIVIAVIIIIWPVSPDGAALHGLRRGVDRELVGAWHAGIQTNKYTSHNIMCVYIYIYMCMYVCMYIYIYIHVL